MRLISIKLAGFKSFVDPVSFQVPGQLVGVVGPNGCGKSNIIDAVRWVLGESKASELRGESMQDVIFNGSSQRKAAGRSSVELVFDNALGRAAGQWGQYAEIAVKRILTKDGASTYYINNQVVRRRDIQDIFMGTGLGPRAYAIIGQGMISRIIEARPEELRIFLEEAAGVSKYKERRRETENRLQDTRENLVRIEDILRELHVNLEKLQAQAAVAQKFHTLREDQEEKQKLLWLLRKSEAQAEQEKFFREIEKAQIELEQQMVQLRHLETALEHMRQAHYGAGDQLHQAQGNLYQTNSEIGSVEAQIKFVIESRHRLQTQLSALATQHEQWQAQNMQYQTQLNEAEMQLEELIVTVEQAQLVVQQYDEGLPALEQDWRTAQLKNTELHSKIMRMQQQIELESSHQRNASHILEGLVSRRERLAQEKNSLHLPADTDLGSLRSECEEKQVALEEIRSQLEQQQQQQPYLEQECRNAQQQVNAEAAQHAQLEARLVALKQLQENIQTEVKLDAWIQKHELVELPRLWQKLRIDAGWETALESVLRERILALEISQLDWAQAFFNDAPPAKLALFVPQSVVSGESAAGLKSFVQLLQLNDPGVRALMQDWLHNFYVAENVATAFAERSKLPLGASFVTRQGHMIGNTSVRFHASDSVQDGLLARQQEIDNIVKQLRAQHMLADETRSSLTRAESALSRATQQLQEMHHQQHELTQTVHSLQMEMVKLSELQQRVNQRSTQIAFDLDEIVAQETEQQQIKVASEAMFEQHDAELAVLQEYSEECQTDYLSKEQQLDAARQRLREAERAAQEVAFAEKTQYSKIEEYKRGITTALDQQIQLTENMQQGRLELESLDDQAAQVGLQDLLNKRSEQEKVLADVRHELDQISQHLRQHEEQRLQAERSLQPQRECIMELQLKEQAARLNREQYAQQLFEVQADEVALCEKLNADMRPASLQGEVTRLVNAIAALGAVNLAALDELAQASERKNFLEAQNSDLIEAINTLEDAIYKIDKETRELLQDTFDKVNQHFAELFPILFGGGQAKLMMTGDEILEAGVQVMAQPPGKKNATIHLLSGGEKALTAIALVFSLFQLNPAPFCLLDEVDAPLDDANTERFCNMVKRMSAHTQFLFISHNKIAMEMAQQLIGVTMQEQGVSRIVAVDMGVAKNFASESVAA